MLKSQVNPKKVEEKPVSVSISGMDVDDMFTITNMDFKEALHMLLHREKVSRNEKDIEMNKRVLWEIFNMCVQQKQWKSLSECIVFIAGKHACLQQSVQKFIQDVIGVLNDVPDKEVRLDLIRSLRSVCDSRLYLEREHVDVIKLLSKIYEQDGELTKAADVLGELKIESYGLLTQREKVENMLLQMRLLIQSDQHEKANILSRKFQLNFFNDPQNEDLRIRFYEMKIELDRWTSHLETSRYYWILSSCATLEDEVRSKMVINSAIFCALASKCHEQIVFTQVLLKDRLLKDLPAVCELLRLLSSKELISASTLQKSFEDAVKRTQVMDQTTRFGKKCFSDLNQRIIEHNILTIASYYSRINLTRMAELIGTTVQSCEENIAQLVTSGLMTARIDRFTGIVDFSAICIRECVLNTWADTVSQVMDCTNRVSHHVQKEFSLNARSFNDVDK